MWIKVAKSLLIAVTCHSRIHPDIYCKYLDNTPAGKKAF
jgi:hypothetical protein